MNHKKYVLTVVSLSLCLFAGLSFGQSKSAAQARAAAPRTPKIVDLNTASKTDLVNELGIPEATAQLIIGGRPYAEKTDLTTKKVISQDTFKKIEARITISKAAAAAAAKPKKR